jgi:transcriptional regulator of acetoin/glycerol metabolism
MPVIEGPSREKEQGKRPESKKVGLSGKASWRRCHLSLTLNKERKAEPVVLCEQQMENHHRP